MKIAGTSAEASVLVEQILPHLKTILKEHPRGISEYELLKLLSGRFEGVFTSKHSASLEIFHSHFFLFHCLYQLQKQLRSEGLDLHIFCLDIRIIEPHRDRSAADAGKERNSLEAVDRLREYYLDWSNYQEANEESVAQMIRSAAALLEAHWHKEEAMKVLGLTAPLKKDELNRRYRQLSKKYHPDSGSAARHSPGSSVGNSRRERSNSEEFRKITRAADTLRRILDITPGSGYRQEFQ